MVSGSVSQNCDRLLSDKRCFARFSLVSECSGLFLANLSFHFLQEVPAMLPPAENLPSGGVGLS